ncbi:hypothetical protein [Glutamicibacter sp. 2E12]|uniref:hypothetical protein n=1 Tax=Glutamicibacter sp. 2E12 TaxID=3416181 RepID=UPI003CEA1F51
MSSETAVERDRSAGASIAGYAYQFDLSILLILRALDGNHIQVEGIEDIDVFAADSSTAVQCKYYSSRTFSLPSLREAIVPMLKGFVDGRTWKYRLHVYFSETDRMIPTSLSIDDLKASLTEHKRKPEPHTVFHYEMYTDDDLNRFLENFTISEGIERREQRNLVMAELARALECHRDEAEELFYGNALTVVMDLAMRKASNERIITRDTFLRMINTKTLLFTRWHREHLGIERYVREIGKRASAGRLFHPGRHRVLAVDDPFAWETKSAIKFADVVKRLATEEYGVGRLDSATPWTVVLPDGHPALMELKRSLLDADIAINDGGETISFNPRLLARAPVINTNGKNRKITRTLYDIRIVRESSFSLFLRDGNTVGTVVSTSDSSPSHLDPSTSVLLLPGITLEQFTKVLELGK